jgi:hypothetical protein
MPRVTSSLHYKRHLFLRTAWLNFPKLYALVPLHAQWQIHDFYQPSKELTETELIAHTKDLAKTNPALVHQAGKHVRLLQKVFRYISTELGIPRTEWYRALAGSIQHYNPSPAHMETTDGHRYTIVAVARPELDVQKLVKALVGVVEREISEIDEHASSN